MKHTCETCGEHHHATTASSPDPRRWCSFECVPDDTIVEMLVDRMDESVAMTSQDFDDLHWWIVALDREALLDAAFTTGLFDTRCASYSAAMREAAADTLHGRSL